MSRGSTPTGWMCRAVLRQGQVFVWDGKDEMCSMMQTRVKARGSDPKCVSAQYGRVVVIVTFAGTCQKIDCRQDGYKEDVQTGSPQDSAAARALCQVSSSLQRVAFCVLGCLLEFLPFTMRIGTHLSLTGCCVEECARTSRGCFRLSVQCGRWIQLALYRLMICKRDSVVSGSVKGLALFPTLRTFSLTWLAV